MSENRNTHFGYQTVPTEEKTPRVKAVFESVSSKYDIMNDLMSFGIHRLWKQYTVSLSKIRPGDKVLDLASGTGDLAKRFSQRVGPKGLVILSDINEAMLTVGRENMLNAGRCDNLQYVLANAECLPFKRNLFDCVSIAFGLRNVTDKARALKSMYHVLKPGGRLLILEFSHPTLPGLKPLYDAYSFSLLPLMGKLIANDSDSYRYLAESIRMHPKQDTLRDMVLEAGFDECEYQNLTGGIVALHTAFKY